MEISNLGGSLPVPCVKELAKASLATVPLRYLRPDQDSPVLPDNAQVPLVPVVDFKRLHSKESMILELEKLHRACKEWGFFQVVEHGVKKSTVEKMKREVEGVFNLPLEEKKKLWQQPWKMEGFGQHFVVSELQKLDWADLFFIVTLPLHLRQPHLYSAIPSSFREAVEEYAEELQTLAMRILAQVGKALGIKWDEIEENYEQGWQTMRMNYYPPCPQPDQVIGLNPHSDACGLTILLQVNETKGLQMKKDGKWVPVKPLPDAFIINVGDCLEILTNGVYPSIEHRATVNSAKERLSIATFYNPRLDGAVGPAPSLVSEKTPAKFTTMGTAEFYKGYFARELRGKSYLEDAKVQDNPHKTA